MARTVGVLATNVVANTKQFQLAMVQSAAQAKNFKREVEGSGLPKLDAAVKEIGHSVTSSTRSVNHFLESFAKIGGTIAIAYELGHIIGELWVKFLETGAEKAENFMLALDASKPKDELAQLEKKIQELEATMAKAKESGWERFKLMFTAPRHALI